MVARTKRKTVGGWRPTDPANVEYPGGDGLQHVHACGHSDTGPQPSHTTGIAAHVAIYLTPCVDIWAAYEAIIAVQVPGVQVQKVHVSLGEIDMLADIHAPWTTPMGRETRNLGNWVDKIRQLTPTGAKGAKSGCDCCYVARTSTNVCMVPD